MSIASRIQEIETHIGDVYDTIDYSYDTTGVNKNIINIPKYLKKGYIDIINNGTDTLYSNFPKVSGIGSNLSLTPTYEAPMKLNEIQGDTFQQTYTGKNKFNLTQNNTTYNNVTTQYKGSEFILNGTTSGSANIISLDSANLYSVGTLKAGTYAFTLITNSGYNANNHSSAFYLRKSDFTSVKGHGISENDNFTGTFILEEDTELFVQIYSNSGNIVFNDFHMYFQIEPGSTATDYEPYVGGTVSPNPDYPQAIQNVTGLQNIEVCGKNLFDGELEIGGLGGSGEETTSSTNCRSKNYIEINSNETYTLSADTNENIALRFYDENKNFISSGTSAGSPNTFTTPNNAEYLRFMLINNTDLNTQCQLEKGSATSYEEYKGQNFEVNLGKQLLDESALIIGTFTYDDSGNRIITNNYVSMEFIAVKPNTTYTYSASTPSGYTAIRIASFTGSKTFINRSGNISFTNKTATFTTSSNTYYIAILMYKTTNDADISEISNKQLEKGTKATSYSPYFTPIELCKIGTYQDYIYKNNGDWYIHKEIGKYQITGYESYSKDGNNYAIDPSTARNDFLKNSDGGNCLCTHFFSKLEAKNNYCWIGNASFFVVCKTDVSDASEFRNLMRRITPTLYYILATSTDTLITNTELIEDLETLYTAKSQEGTTNISITSEDLEMILNISALEGDE